MLTFAFDGKCGKMEVPEKLISGTFGKQVLLKFSSDWDGLQKTAVFMALDGSMRTAYSTDVTEEILLIPPAVLANPEHTLYVQVQGFSPDGTEIINTGRVKGPRILPGLDAGELPEIDGKNPVWYDVLNQMGDLTALKTTSKSTLVSAINELASNGNKEIFLVDLVTDDDGGYHASATYYEIAHARASDKLVLLRYGIFMTHILAGEPTEGSFLFEPLLHSVQGMPGYIVDTTDNWNAAPITEDSEKQVSDNFIVMLEQDDSGEYLASAAYMEIAEARGAGKLVLLRYGDFVTHILSGAPTDTSFLFEPLLHSVPGMPGYIVDIQDNWNTAPLTRDDVLVADIVDDLETEATDQPLSAAQGVVLKGLIDDLAREGNEILVYGHAEDATICYAVMNGRPVYCWYEHLYHLPLVSWEEATHTAVFGGCYDSKTITCKAVAGEWSVETMDVSEPDVFVGTEDTTVAQFHEAFSSGKPCFLRKANAGEGIIMWVAYTCSSSKAEFYRITSDGSVQYGVLSDDGTFSYETAGTSGSCESNVFVGDNDTTLAEFKAAYDSGKTCFLRRSNPSGYVTYTAYNVTATNAFFFAVNSTGGIMYGYLDSNHVFTAQERKHVTSIDENSTDTQIPTAKAVYDTLLTKLDADMLTEATNAALAQAKESGEFDGYSPVKGVDYYTEEDKAEIVAAVIESLGGSPVFGYVDEHNNIIVQGNLPDGTYTVKYEMEDGTTVDIGDLVLDNNTYYSITNNLTNCTNGNSATQAALGSSYSATISANSGYELSSVVVTMGGMDITKTAVSSGTISIASVTGNIVITATVTEARNEPTNLAKPDDVYWKDGHKLSISGGGTSALDGHTTTNFIPAQADDIVYVKGMNLVSEINGSDGYKIVFYSTLDTESSKVGGLYGATVNNGDCFGTMVSTNGDVSSFKVMYANNGAQRAGTTCKYIRIDGALLDGYTKDDVIITVNVSIE